MTAPTACPSCGATVRPDSPWCTLCYADLRATPEPPPAPPATPPAPAAPSASPGPPEPPAATTPAGAAPETPSTPTWPCTACGTRNSFDRDTCSACGLGFMADARDTTPLLELPVVGDITRLSRGQRLALGAAVVLAFVVLTVLIGLILG